MMAVNGIEVRLITDDRPQIAEGDRVTLAGLESRSEAIAYAYANHSRHMVGYNGPSKNNSIFSILISLVIGGFGLLFLWGLFILLPGESQRFTVILIVLFMILGLLIFLWGLFQKTREGVQMSAAGTFVRKIAPYFERAGGKR